MLHYSNFFLIMENIDEKCNIVFQVDAMFMQKDGALQFNFYYSNQFHLFHL
jgi:hypothetical protein